MAIETPWTPGGRGELDLVASPWTRSDEARAIAAMRDFGWNVCGLSARTEILRDYMRQARAARRQALASETPGVVH